ncbi:DUF4349 domain-containing protein [Kaistella palustris]|uniref:DUF4349 domain-containing protein n=1 Tax=Kaistella palustris TaxID=493376 RepID=UPI000412BD4E|nr:DUF4349 domain-containing protein [Kaistella palustris]
MKNLILAILFAAALISCDKSTIQQTTDSIKTADSIFDKTGNRLKTLDSIRKSISDSDGIAKKVIIPEIVRQKKVIDSTIRSGAYTIDSINRDFERITKNVKVGTDVAKTLDSANDAINRGESPLKVLTRTADKILKQTRVKSSPAEDKNLSTSPPQKDMNTIPSIRQDNPVTKTAALEIEVDDLSAAKATLKQKVRENNADLVSENFSSTEGVQRNRLSIKVPLQNFDDLVNTISSQLGDVRMKSMTSEGTDYQSAQMCDVEITLVQNEKMAGEQFGTEAGKTDSFGSKSSGAFMQGFDLVKKMVLALLPFWPFFLIAAAVLFFILKSRRKKEISRAKDSVPDDAVVTDKLANDHLEEAPADSKPDDLSEPDYSKYLPKN